MKIVHTKRLTIRNWEDRDRDFFHRINSDEQVMAFYDFRRTRAESDAMMDRLRTENAARGFGFGALELTESGECIGFSGLYPVSIVPARPDGSVEIGWRLAPERWSQGYATEAARALLEFGFTDLDLKEIISFAVWNNDRSTTVMRRIGMRHEPAGDFDHPRVSDAAPHLKRHVLYTLPRDLWLAERAAANSLNPS